MDIDNNFAQIIANSISNDGKLRLYECKTLKLEYEAFGVALGDKHVVKKHNCLNN